MTGNRVAIIGSGVAGLACAARLKKEGLDPLVLDKGRGVGGRLATRRADGGLRFDHGAQYITAKSEDFQTVLDEAVRAGKAAVWETGDRGRFVGVPGMNGLAKHLAEGIAISQNALVTAVRETAKGCEVVIDDAVHAFDRVVLTVPAPQAIGLLEDECPLSRQISGVELLPCLTLMVAFSEGCDVAFNTRRDPEDSISWLALDSSKPARSTIHCWVAQANPDWSARHLEEDPEAIAERMLSMVCDRLGMAPSSAVHAVAHRWRYASVSKPFGEPFLGNEEGTLYLGGDWCLDARVEAAWTSGTAIANDMLKRM